MTPITQAKTADLIPHPLLDRVGTMPGLCSHFQTRSKKMGKNREEAKELAIGLHNDFQALVASVKELGILEPVKVCRDDGRYSYIVDGRNRWLAAKEAKLATIPVIEVRPEDAAEIIAATVSGRRHYTKGATAYLACILHPEVVLENKPGRNSRTECANSRIQCATGLDALAAKFSVSPRLLDQAVFIYRALEGDGRPYRDQIEADIWANMGLGAVMSGLAYLMKHGSKENPKKPESSTAWKKFCGFTRQLKQAGQYWGKLEPSQMEAASAHLRATLASIPAEMKELIGEQLLNLP